LRAVQNDELASILTSDTGTTPAEFNDALLVAVATVLHEGGIVAAPTGDEKRCLGINAPRVKAGRPRK